MKGSEKMSFSNFFYDDIALSDFNNGKYVIGYFSTNDHLEEGKQNINQVSLFNGREQPFVYINYEDTLSFTITVIKNPCVTDQYAFTIEEMEELKRWLCRPAPHRFKIDAPDYVNIFWEGTFEIEEEVIGAQRGGLTLTFKSTRPYALQDDVIYSGGTEANQEILINDVSTEIGYIYPTIVVTCLTGGNLSIYNDFDQRTTIVNNCSANETITFSKYLQISTTDSGHAISNDFNYQFLRIGNNYVTTENIITFSLPCEYTITYNPIRKVLPI